MRILLVDDEPMILELMEERVAKVIPDAHTSAFSKATEAMEYAKEHKPDIAFLDINMRVMDGITMAKQLIEYYPRINIIFCTGYTEYMQEAFDMYCSGYLVKPVTEDKLKKAIDHLRYRVENNDKEVYFRCFGSFEAFFRGRPIEFKYKRTKELLAYLVDRNGADVSTQELMAVIFEDENRRSYFNHLRQDLINTFKNLGIEDVLRSGKGRMGINRKMVKCDHFDYQDRVITTPPTEYMTQYTFGEITYPHVS